MILATAMKHLDLWLPCKSLQQHHHAYIVWWKNALYACILKKMYDSLSYSITPYHILPLFIPWVQSSPSFLHICSTCSHYKMRASIFPLYFKYVCFQTFVKYLKTCRRKSYINCNFTCTRLNLMPPKYLY